MVKNPVDLNEVIGGLQLKPIEFRKNLMEEQTQMSLS